MILVKVCKEVVKVRVLLCECSLDIMVSLGL